MLLLYVLLGLLVVAAAVVAWRVWVNYQLAEAAIYQYVLTNIRGQQVCADSQVSAATRCTTDALIKKYGVFHLSKNLSSPAVGTDLRSLSRKCTSRYCTDNTSG